MSSYLFSSESVSPGHPDKLCDRISDAILDSYLQGDPDSHVAVECMATANKLLISGEVSSNAALTSNDIERIARDIIQVTGYDKDEYLYTFNKTNVEVLINRQSPDIAQGVDRQDPRLQGAGDQGIMFGYATDETPHFMPLPIMLAHEIMDYFYRYRRSHPDCILRPDAKSQVTVQYEDNVPVKIDTILISHQHDDVPQEEVNKFISEVLNKFLLENFGEGCKYPSHLIQDNMKVYINPTGKFVIGGPVGDCGLTGRKIIVDTYGGRSAHGGGAFSGKDPSKVDRSAAYMARYIAKNLVATRKMSQCSVQLAYGIGMAEPISVYITSNGTCQTPDEKLSKIVQSVFDLTPYGIIQKLDLKRPIFYKTAFGGHFGREIFPWEQIDMAETLKNLL